MPPPAASGQKRVGRPPAAAEVPATSRKLPARNEAREVWVNASNRADDQMNRDLEEHRGQSGGQAENQGDDHRPRPGGQTPDKLSNGSGGHSVPFVAGPRLSRFDRRPGATAHAALRPEYHAVGLANGGGPRYRSVGSTKSRGGNRKKRKRRLWAAGALETCAGSNGKAVEDGGIHSLGTLPCGM